MKDIKHLRSSPSSILLSIFRPPRFQSESNSAFRASRRAAVVFCRAVAAGNIRIERWAWIGGVVCKRSLERDGSPQAFRCDPGASKYE